MSGVSKEEVGSRISGAARTLSDLQSLGRHALPAELLPDDWPFQPGVEDEEAQSQNEQLRLF